MVMRAEGVCVPFLAGGPASQGRLGEERRRKHCPGWLEERLERRGGLSAACHGSCRPPARVQGLADFLLDVQAGYGVVAAVEAG